MSAAASEKGHFYMPDGTPFYDVPNKSRPGELRSATVRDALKVGAEPSVSTVLKAAAAPQLTRWFVEKALESAIRLERLPGESPEEFKARALADSQEQSAKARDDGTALHGALERHLLCQPFDERFQPHVRCTVAALAEIGIDLSAGLPERSFCLPGYFGGKLDWNDGSTIVDFKGIDDSKLEGKLGWPDHIRQLSAYGMGLKMRRPRLVNVFIARGSGGVRVREWTHAEADKALAEFLALLRFYRLTKGFPVDGLKEAA